jgi:DNA repair exonuclease SbcCD nuclease subunit
MKLLLTTDWHLDNNNPLCRTDLDYWGTVKNKIRFVFKTAIKNKCNYILNSADLFEMSVPYNVCFMLTELMSLFDEELINYKIPFITTAGNHDLPYHNLNNLNRSALGVLSKAGYVQILDDYDQGTSILKNGTFIKGFSYGVRFEDAPENKCNIGMIHEYVFKKKVPEYMSGTTAKDLVEMYEGWDLILSGHNHEHFVTDIGSTKVVNIGSLLRTKASQHSYIPQIGIYDTETKSLELINVPIQENVVSREHIEVQKEKDQRIAAYVEHLNNNYISGLDFEGNMENHIKVNKFKEKTNNKIWDFVKK